MQQSNSFHLQKEPGIQTNKEARGELLGADGIKLVRGGKDYFDLLVELAGKAKHSIHLQTYIYDDDETGTMVADALKAATKRKVQVYLLVDGYASQWLPKSFIHSLLDAGIQFRRFEPLFKSKYFYFGRRMHHKIFVVDTDYALVGGINIANRYNDLPEQKAWLDFALYVSGNIAKELCVLCWKTWHGYPKKMELLPFEKEQTVVKAVPQEKMSVVMRRNDWVRGKNQVSKSYIGMLQGAETQVIICCSYFLPGKVIRRNIVRAIERGVSVKVITAGSSDVMLAKHAERWLYDWMFRRGVDLYEYRDNILHAKLAVCDDRWVTIGSYNLNDISAYASIELNIDVYDKSFAREARQILEEIMNGHSIQVTQQHHASTRNIFIQFVRWFSYRFIRIVFYLFTFYFKRQP